MPRPGRKKGSSGDQVEAAPARYLVCENGLSVVRGLHVFLLPRHLIGLKLNFSSYFISPNSSK